MALRSFSELAPGHKDERKNIISIVRLFSPKPARWRLQIKSNQLRNIYEIMSPIKRERERERERETEKERLRKREL